MSGFHRLIVSIAAVIISQKPKSMRVEQRTLTLFDLVYHFSYEIIIHEFVLDE